MLLDELRALFPETLSRFEGLAGFHDRFQNRPRIRSYIDSLPRLAVFRMGLHGPKIDPATRLEKGEVLRIRGRSPCAWDKPRTESDNSAAELIHVSVMMGPVPTG